MFPNGRSLLPDRSLVLDDYQLVAGDEVLQAWIAAKKLEVTDVPRVTSVEQGGTELIPPVPPSPDVETTPVDDDADDDAPSSDRQPDDWST